MKMGASSEDTGVFLKEWKAAAPQKIVFDMKTVTGIQLLTEDFVLINTRPENVLSIEVDNPVTAWPDRPPSPATEGDYEISSAKIVLKDAHAVAEPRGWGEEDSGPEARERSYKRLLSGNIYGISIEQNGDWQSYYFSPAEWTITEDEGVAINNRVTIEQDASGCAIITVCAIDDVVAVTIADDIFPNGMEYHVAFTKRADGILKILAPEEEIGVPAEYAWMRKEYPGAVRSKQKLFFKDENGKRTAFDKLSITLPDGTKRELVFDISMFFGKHEGGKEAKTCTEQF
jgi:hypothetical protein